MNLNPLIQAQIDGRLLDVAYVLEIATTPPTRAWTGAGDIVLNGNTFRGLGVWTDVPSFTSLINGVANRLELSLSGVDAQVMALANGDAEEVRGKAVTMGLLFMDRALQPIGDIIPVGDYEADVISTDSSSSSEFGRVRTVSLSIGSITTGRRRPPLNFWTRARQILRSATDRFCDLVSRYTNDSEMKWPP